MSNGQRRELTPDEALRMKEACKEWISTAEAMKRLEANPDYIQVFTKGYLEKESVRLVKCLAEAEFIHNGAERRMLNREDLMEQMQGIARFNEYVRSLWARADMALKELNSLEEAEQRFYEATGE